MKLLITPTSPYARKAHIVVLEKQLPCEVEVAVPWDNVPIVVDNNPLRKIPILLLDSGEPLLDSRVICDYLEAQGGAPRLLPDDAAERWRAQTRIAIAEGAMDAALAIIMAGRVSPDMATAEWKQWLMEKTTAALDYFEKQVQDGGFDLSDITLGCLLGTLDFRMAEALDWRAGRPRLAAHWEALSARPSFSQTVPRA